MIVKPARRVVRFAGQVLDEEDRKIIGAGLLMLAQGAVLLLVGVALLFVVAVTAGLAVSVYQHVRF